MVEHIRRNSEKPTKRRPYLGVRASRNYCAWILEGGYHRSIRRAAQRTDGLRSGTPVRPEVRARGPADLSLLWSRQVKAHGVRRGQTLVEESGAPDDPQRPLAQENARTARSAQGVTKPVKWTRQETLELPGSIDGLWEQCLEEPDRHGIGMVPMASTGCTRRRECCEAQGPHTDRPLQRVPHLAGSGTPRSGRGGLRRV